MCMLLLSQKNKVWYRHDRFASDAVLVFSLKPDCAESSLQ